MHRRNEAESLYKEWSECMEFELERTQLGGYDPVLDTTLFQEETLEMIVPDACPDLERVVDVAGQVLLRSREAMEGRVELGGFIQAQVLCVPDGEEGLRHLDVTIPFTAAAEVPEACTGAAVVVDARLRRADARLVNPRKVLVRAEAALDVRALVLADRELCVDVTAEEGAVERRMEPQELYLTACVEEKSFHLSDTLTLSGARSPAAELLRSRVEVVCGESKLIGSKLIFKGSANVALLCRGEDGSLTRSGGEVPFSQIMEVSGVGEGADCAVSLSLSGCQCILTPEGEGRSVDLSLDVLAQAVVGETRSLEVVTDAYSTKEPLEAQWETCALPRLLDSGVRTQNVREVWETGVAARDILDSSFALAQVTQSWEGGKLTLTAQGEATVLYTGEDGTLSAVTRGVSVPCALDLPENCRCLCLCRPVGEVYAAPSAVGMELRFALDFQYQALEVSAKAVLSGLTPGQSPQEEPQPSLILRRLSPGESLWDMAKAGGATIADIISANELEDETQAGDRLLLIPRKR